MPEFLTAPFSIASGVSASHVLVRLLVALVLGGSVAWVYRRTRSASEMGSSFPGTLVLLAILIAMVTQVVGGSVARAFSLVGALSIVRFRTVVRDTQDTAFVIFAVVVGMAAGASDWWVAVIGLGVVAAAAYLTRSRSKGTPPGEPLPFMLTVRVGLGHDLEALLGGLLDQHLAERRLSSMATARQGLAVDVSYEAQLRADAAADALVKALNQLGGVQSVQLQRRDATDGR